MNVYPEYFKRTFIIIPAYNEGMMIGKVIEGLLPLGARIVIVDDGSTDEPGKDICEQPMVSCIRHKVNLGQGAAIQTGIDFSLQQGAHWLITFDADGQHSVSDLPALMEPLVNNEADIVLASRFLEKGSHNAPLMKQVLLKAGRWVNYLFTGLYLSDAHNGLRAMNRAAALTIRIRENRMAHATEILAQVRKNQLKYREVGASVLYTDYSKSKGQSSLNSLKIFFDLVLQKLFG